MVKKRLRLGPPGAGSRAQTGDAKRDTLMAMLKHLDDGVGRIVGTLKREQIFDNTLLVFLTDNGGAKSMRANNAPLRGFKQEDYEGGIRVPFIVSWPAQLKGGTTCDVPVSSIDLLPTALAAAGLPFPRRKPLDGKDMLPALNGEVDTLHDQLFWSSGGARAKWAIRSGRWKLVGEKRKVELFDLERDVGESTDLSKRHPEKVVELKQIYDHWLDQMAEPNNGAPKRWSPGTASISEFDRKLNRADRRKKRR